MKRLLCLAFPILLGIVAQLPAATITFNTPLGVVDGGAHPLDGQAVFFIDGNQLQITLSNLQTNVVEDGQTLDGLSFQLNGAIPQGATIQSMTMSDGPVIDITSKSQPYSLDTGAPPTWNLSNSINGSSYTFSFCNINANLLGCQGQGNDWPAGNIIGPADAQNTFPNANGSITTGSHNPWIYEQATFTITLQPGQNFSADPTAYSNVNFGFGTGSSFSQVTGTQPTPEPGAFLLGGLGLAVGLARVRRKP